MFTAGKHVYYAFTTLCGWFYSSFLNVWQELFICSFLLLVLTYSNYITLNVIKTFKNLNLNTTNFKSDKTKILINFMNLKFKKKYLQEENFLKYRTFKLNNLTT